MSEETTNTEQTREYSAPQVLEVEQLGALLTGSGHTYSHSYSWSDWT